MPEWRWPSTGFSIELGISFLILLALWFWGCWIWAQRPSMVWDEREGRYRPARDVIKDRRGG